MKCIHGRVVATMSLAFALTFRATAQSLPATDAGSAQDSYYGYQTRPTSAWDEFCNSKWIRDRLSVGLVVSTFHFTDNKRDIDYERYKNFIGAVTELNEEDKVVFAPVVNYRASDHVRFGLSYDRVTARTKNFNNHLSDGNVVYRGPTLTAEGTLPLLDNRLVPHAGIGVAFLFSDFQEDTWWNYGWSSPESWEFHGKQQTSPNSRYRQIHPDSTVTYFFTAGVTFKPVKWLGVDVSAGYMPLDPDCEWGTSDGNVYTKHRDGDFDLTHFSYALSVSYLF